MGLAWLGLKCVKTGSLITVFGNISKKKKCFFLFGLLLFPFVLVLLLEHVVYHARQRISDVEIGEQFSEDSQSLRFPLQSRYY